MDHLFSKLYIVLRQWAETEVLEGSLVALCNAFPTLFNMVAHKHARVAEVWDSSRVDGGWSPVFQRPFNDWEMEEVEKFFLVLHNKKIRPSQED